MTALTGAGLAGLTSLTACSSGSGGTSGASNLSLVGNQGWSGGTKAVVDAFHKAHPDLEVKPTFLDDADYSSTLGTQLQSGSASDVIGMWTTANDAGCVWKVAQAGYVIDLGDDAYLKGLSNVFRSLVTPDGKPYATWPSAVALAGAYHIPTFESAGVEPPKNWSELIGLASAFDGLDVEPGSFGLQDAAIAQFLLYPLAASLVYAKDPTFEKKRAEGSATFADSEWVTVLEKIIELRDKKVFADGSLSTAYTDSLAAVASGRAAWGVAATISINDLRDSASSPDDIGFFAIPADDNLPTYTSLGLTGGYGVNSALKGEQKDAAIEFVKFMQDNKKIYNDVDGGFDPAGQEPPSDAAMRLLADVVADGHTYTFCNVYWNNDATSALTGGVQSLFAGKSSPKEILDAMDAAYTPSEIAPTL